MLNDFKFDSAVQLKIAKECRNLVNKNCNLAVIQLDNKPMTRYKAAVQRLPAWTKKLCFFGKARVVKIEKNDKLGNIDPPVFLLIIQTNTPAIATEWYSQK